MKHTGLMFTSLALCCTAAHAAGEASYSNGILHIPHVHYSDKMYDVKMAYTPPDKLTLQTAPELQSMPTDYSMVSVSESLKFKLTEIDVGGGITYRADIEITQFPEFKVSGIRPSTHGKMFKGEKITALGWLVEGAFSYAYAVSDDGKNIAGRNRNASRQTVATRYNFETGEMIPLDVLGSGRDEARSINNSGVLAGYGTLESEDGTRIYNAFYNTSGTALVNIGTLGEGTDSRAYGINNNGVFVGWSASKADNSDHVAYTYDTSTNEMAGLGGGILGGQRSFAFDINDANQIAGVATTADGSAVAFLYEGGAAKNLGSLDDSGYSEARAINDKGHTTGWSLTADGTYAAFIHDGTSMTALPGFGGDSKAYDINTHGHVVGDGRGADGSRHAFLYKDGQLIDLYEALPEADKANWKELREAYSISDDGVIVGRGRFYTDKENGKHSSMAFRIQL